MKQTGKAIPSHGAFVGADVDKNAVALVAEMLRDPHVLSRLAAPALPVVACESAWITISPPHVVKMSGYDHRQWRLEKRRTAQALHSGRTA